MCSVLWFHACELVWRCVLQACDITGGLYLKVPQMPSLLQYLLVRSRACLPGKEWVQHGGHQSLEGRKKGGTRWSRS